MSMMVSFVLSFFPRDVLDEILNLIESVSEDFPSYSSITVIEVNKSSSKGVLVHHHVFPPFLPGEINFETSLFASMDKNSTSKIGSTLKGKNFVLEEKILFFFFFFFFYFYYYFFLFIFFLELNPIEKEGKQKRIEILPLKVHLFTISNPCNKQPNSHGFITILIA